MLSLLITFSWLHRDLHENSLAVQSEVGPQSLDNLSQGENLVGAASAIYWYLHTQYLEIGQFYRFVDLTVSAVI